MYAELIIRPITILTWTFVQLVYQSFTPQYFIYMMEGGLNDYLLVYVPLFHLYGDVTIAGEGLQKNEGV
jgi:hypothetical protein